MGKVMGMLCDGRYDDVRHWEIEGSSKTHGAGKVGSSELCLGYRAEGYEIVDSGLRRDRFGNVRFDLHAIIDDPDKLYDWLITALQEENELSELLRTTARRMVDEQGGIEAIRASYEAHRHDPA